jgi:NAD(P)H-dependent flavin oxidoreductase YrpB (nitropropane dioxygenase family)
MSTGPHQKYSKGTVARAIAAGCLVIGSKVAVVLKSGGSAVKVGSLLLGSAGAAAAYSKSLKPEQQER